MNTIGDICRIGAKRWPDKAALVMGARIVTYGELDRWVNRVANGLLAAGAGPGERVAILAENSIEFVVAALATVKAGAALVPLNFRYGPREVEFALEDATPRVIFAGDGYVDALTGADTTLLSLEATGPGSMQALARAQSEGAPDIEIEPDSVATVLYTSGTTGRPKGVMASHRATMRLLPAYAVEGDLRGSDTMLICMPLFHGGGLVMQLFPALAFGATVVIAARGFHPGQTLELIERHGVTVTLWAPTMLGMLVAHDSDAERDLSSLQKIWYGSSSISATVLRATAERFPQARLYQWYGTTEVTSVAILRPEDHATRSHLTGREIFTTEAIVIDKQGRQVGPGELGELVVSAAACGTLGYLNQPEETQRVMHGGWFHTGDIVRVEDDGFFTVVDRLNDMIISGGENIFPREVEQVIAEHPSVAEVAVYGVPDERYGDAVWAAVVRQPRSRLDEEEIAAWCADRIGRYKRPQRVVLMDELPKNATGKVLKRELRRMAAEPDQAAH